MTMLVNECPSKGLPQTTKVDSDTLPIRMTVTTIAKKRIPEEWTGSSSPYTKLELPRTNSGRHVKTAMFLDPNDFPRYPIAKKKTVTAPTESPENTEISRMTETKISSSEQVANKKTLKDKVMNLVMKIFHAIASIFSTVWGFMKHPFQSPEKESLENDRLIHVKVAECIKD
jgi:hypothetical protein